MVQCTKVCAMHDADLLTIAQVAKELDESRWTVWRRIKNGELAATQPGGPNGVHVISRAELDRYLAESAA